MNRLLLLVAVSSIALAGCGRSADNPARGTPSTTLAVSNGASSGGLFSITRDVRPSILIEAESGAVKPPVVVKEEANASEGRCVIAPEGPDHTEISVGGDVTYKVHVAEAGDYYLWLRANWSGGCGNSMDISMDGKALGYVEDAVYETWHWVPLQRPLRKLTAGDHLFTLGNREDGAAADQILLTQDADYRPTGIESLNAQGRTNGAVAAATTTTLSVTTSTAAQ